MGCVPAQGSKNVSLKIPLVYCWEQKQYLAFASLDGEAGRIVRKTQLERFARAQLARKSGQQSALADAKIDAKLRRVKTYMSIVQENNMLRQLGSGIAKFVIQKNAAGDYPCPFTWSSLILSLYE